MKTKKIKVKKIITSGKNITIKLADTSDVTDVTETVNPDKRIPPVKR